MGETHKNSILNLVSPYLGSIEEEGSSEENDDSPSREAWTCVIFIKRLTFVLWEQSTIKMNRSRGTVGIKQICKHVFFGRLCLFLLDVLLLENEDSPVRSLDLRHCYQRWTFQVFVLWQQSTIKMNRPRGVGIKQICKHVFWTIVFIPFGCVFVFLLLEETI